MHKYCQGPTLICKPLIEARAVLLLFSNTFIPCLQDVKQKIYEFCGKGEVVSFLLTEIGRKDFPTCTDM